MLVNSSLYLTCFKCFLKDYLVYIKIYSSVCILKSNTHIHTYRHKHPSTVLFRNMLNSNIFLQYSLGLTRITGCWHAISPKHQFSLKNIYRNLNSCQVNGYRIILQLNRKQRKCIKQVTSIYFCTGYNI